MVIDRIEVIHTEVPLNQTFRTSFGEIRSQHSVITRVYGEGLVGYGEACPFYAPIYSYEFVGSMKLVLRELIIPRILGRNVNGPEDYLEKVEFIRGHNHAKAALETALWDLQARKEGRPLWQLLGGTRPQVEVGVSIGIQPTVKGLLAKIDGYLADGYRRIKIKIEPGRDLDVVKAVRGTFPDITLMVDANSAYGLCDAEVLARLDDYNLLMIEQPLAEDDLVDHADLQRRIRTPICLDESIHSADDARKAAKIGSCRIVNVKYGRVGGLLRSMQIHDVCQSAGIPNWAGGMIETGVGQRFKIALSTLENFTYAADIETSDRFLVEDVVEPNIVQRGGYIDTSVGYAIDEAKLNRYTVEKSVFTA